MVNTKKKPVGRKEAILKTAWELFQKKSYNETTMQDVMDTLNIAKGTIYHYFKSKEALFEAVIENIVEKNIEETELLMKKAKGNALQKLKLLVGAGKIAEENDNIVKQLHKPSNDAMHSRLLAVAITKQAPFYAEIIQQGCREGLFKTKAPLECAEFVLSAIQFLTDIGVYPWERDVLKRRIQAFPHLIEQLLKAPSGSFQFLIDQINE